ncbi:MAG: outer membrane protein assembly factor BamD [Planctomycetota bacterium]|nr:outer membrane protein assembly factor BamD [Planctomycetota bacterium]
MQSNSRAIANRDHSNRAGTTLLACAIGSAMILGSGCAWFQRPEAKDPFMALNDAPPAADGVVRTNYQEPSSGKPSQVVNDETQTVKPTGLEAWSPENISKEFKEAVGLGRDRNVAQSAFDEAEKLFEAKDYAAAEKKYAETVSRYSDSQLEENAMFMQAQSLFFQDKYSDALDLYGELFKKYPNTQHLDKSIQQLFLIGKYWVEIDREKGTWPVVPNATDKTRPWFDTFGNAVLAFDQVRLNDPRGDLADDSLVAIANAYFVKGRYHDADYHYKLIRTEYPKSEYQAHAHLLGLRCKLAIYQGPDYDGAALIEAEELIDQMLTQFPDELRDERERLIQSKAEVIAQRAYREYHMAQFYENGSYYGAAKFYYKKLIKQYPGTGLAKQSQQRLEELKNEPDNPPDRFAFLNPIFGEPRNQANRR